MSPIALLITCEHGGNQIPKPYQDLFESSKARLKTHEGYDKGALTIATSLSKIDSAPHFFIYSTTSRLLIDLNRSLKHPHLFSNITRSLSVEQKKTILAYEYTQHWETIEEKIKQWQTHGYTVLHIASHSFTPIFKGKIRETDIGLLYDPQRKLEREFAIRWRNELHRLSYHQFNIHFNRPYQGKTDGLASALRKKFKKNYLGFELEINQRLFEENKPRLLAKLIQASVKTVISHSETNPAQ